MFSGHISVQYQSFWTLTKKFGYTSIQYRCLVSVVLGCMGECPGSVVRAPSGCLLDDRAGWPGVAMDDGSSSRFTRWQ